MYYAVLTLSVVLFGIAFFFNKKYTGEIQSGIDATLFSLIIGGSVGLVFLLILNNAQIEFAPFSFAMAFVDSINGFLFAFCSLKAFEVVNLSLYSVFSMLGGMLIPAVQGMIFYGEPLTFGKAICILLIAFALLLTIEKGKNKGGMIYCAGIFVFNGLAGVISKIHQEGPYRTTNLLVYLMWMCIITISSSLIILFFIRKNIKKPNKKSVLYASGNGAFTYIAKYLLLIALTVLPSSVQYPFITGGIMIVSTIISALAGEKPSKREVSSVAVSFIGILALMLL